MAKIRVYELAKDLNMTNTALLNKLKELKIEVKSHMSSLEDSEVSAVRKNILGKEKKNNGARSKQTVIRRRRQAPEKVLRPKPEDAAPIESKTATKPRVALSEKEVAAEPEKQVKSSEKDASVSVEPKSRTLIKKTQPARIIKPAAIQPSVEAITAGDGPEASPPPSSAATEPEPQIPDDIVQKDASAPGTEHPEAASILQPSEAEQTLTSDQAPDSTAELEGKKIAADESPGSEEEEKEPDEKEIDSEDDEDKEAKARKKKKKKKSTPAKIVKIADPTVLENIKKTVSQEDQRRAAQSLDDRIEIQQKNKDYVIPGFHGDDNSPSLDEDGAGQEDTDTGKWKKDRRKELFAPDDLPSNKKRGRRQKSVIEGEDLYNTAHSRKKRGKKEAKGKKGKFQKTQITTPKAIKRRIKIDDAIELAELAKRMGIKANEMIAKLMTLGVMATVNQTIDFETASLVATEFDFEVEKASFEEETLLHIEDENDDGNLIGRAPVVTIMGHVDHGKTSLLDVIRKSKIVSGEAGGITQHIGAYNVETPNGGRITFLDTPGHAAFTAMRSRGAQVTDIVILVVAADDGVMPQTIEAINHSKAAGVPVVVAVNKMDKPGADPDRIMRELSEQDLLAEEWGGNVIFVKVSAKTGQGIDDLLEMVLLQSEVLELKANPERKASGYVVESRLDIGRGAVATVLVKQGTLKEGDPVVCGLHSGRIRAMIDDAGNRISEAGPSTPVEIVGLNGIPNAGDEFVALASEKDAKQIASHRMQKQRARELAKKSRANLEKMFENLGGAEVKELRLIVKADVHGSIEALNDSLKDLAKEEVDVKIVHSGTGTINESDVSLAAVSDAIIIGFNVRPTPQIRALAKDENVDMRFYDIIYDVINDIKSALDGMMPSTFHEIIIGRAEVRETFVVPKMGTIAGCHITEGKVVRGKKVRLLRDGVIKCDTALSSLRRFKDDVKEVEQGYECGIGLDRYNDIKIGDTIECYEVEERKYKAD